MTSNISKITNSLEHNLLVYLSVSKYINNYVFRLSVDEIDNLKQYLFLNGKRINENNYIFVMCGIPLILTIEYGTIVRMRIHKF